MCEIQEYFDRNNQVPYFCTQRWVLGRWASTNNTSMFEQRWMHPPKEGNYLPCVMVLWIGGIASSLEYSLRGSRVDIPTTFKVLLLGPKCYGRISSTMSQPDLVLTWRYMGIRVIIVVVLRGGRYDIKVVFRWLLSVRGGLKTGLRWNLVSSISYCTKVIVGGSFLTWSLWCSKLVLKDYLEYERFLEIGSTPELASEVWLLYMTGWGNPS